MTIDRARRGGGGFGGENWQGGECSAWGRVRASRRIFWKNLDKIGRAAYKSNPLQFVTFDGRPLIFLIDEVARLRRLGEDGSSRCACLHREPISLPGSNRSAADGPVI